MRSHIGDKGSMIRQRPPRSDFQGAVETVGFAIGMKVNHFFHMIPSPELGASRAPLGPVSPRVCVSAAL